MRKGFLGCALVSVAGASLAPAQGPSPYQPIARDGAALPADVAKQTSPVTPDGKTGAVTTVPAGLVGGGCAGNNSRNSNGGGNSGCGRDGRVWGSIEYLAWWIKDAHA